MSDTYQVYNEKHIIKGNYVTFNVKLAIIHLFKTKSNKEEKICFIHNFEIVSFGHKKWFWKDGGSGMPFVHTGTKSMQPKTEDNVLIMLLSHPYQNMSSYSLMGDQ